jgi:peptidoglycan hydrolase CwlO-like protein
MKKCTHCGGSNLRKTDVPFGAEGFSVCTYVDHKNVFDHLEVLICMDCAHFEWFSEKLVDALKEKDSRIAQLNTELETLKAKLATAQEKLSAINIKIAETEEKLKSLDITIREQQSLLSAIETLKKERYGVQKEIRTAEQSIRSLQSKLNNN